MPTDFTEIVKQKMPAVVAITTKPAGRRTGAGPITAGRPAVPRILPPLLWRALRAAPGNGHGRLRSGRGSSAQTGTSFTNNHVVEDQAEIHVGVGGAETTSRQSLSGRGIRPTDIAVLKVDPAAQHGDRHMGRLDAAEPGSWVIAIGSPFRPFGGTVTVGVDIRPLLRDIRSAPMMITSRPTPPSTGATTAGRCLNARGDCRVLRDL